MNLEPGAIPLRRAMTDAVVVVASDGAITFWSTAAERLFGYARGEAVGASLDIIIPARHRALHWKAYASAVETGDFGQEGKVLRVPALHADGHAIRIRFTLSAIRSQDDRIHGFAAIIWQDPD